MEVCKIGLITVLGIKSAADTIMDTIRTPF
jgi:hypothetical protein